MAGATIAISETVRRQLQELAARSGRSAEEELARAVEERHRREFWEAVNAAYAALRADPAAWAEVEAERREFEGTLLDGLDPTERWGDDGAPLPPDGGQTP